MKRFVAVCLGLALIVPVTIGCERQQKVESQKTVETPQGQTTVTQEKTVESSGDNPPAVDGQKVNP